MPRLSSSGKTAMDGATLKADDAGISGPAATGPPNSLAFFLLPPPRAFYIEGFTDAKAPQQDAPATGQESLTVLSAFSSCGQIVTRQNSGGIGVLVFRHESKRTPMGIGGGVHG